MAGCQPGSPPCRAGGELAARGALGRGAAQPRGVPPFSAPLRALCFLPRLRGRWAPSAPRRDGKSSCPLPSPPRFPSLTLLQGWFGSFPHPTFTFPRAAGGAPRPRGFFQPVQAPSAWGGFRRGALRAQGGPACTSARTAARRGSAKGSELNSRA